MQINFKLNGAAGIIQRSYRRRRCREGFRNAVARRWSKAHKSATMIQVASFISQDGSWCSVLIDVVLCYQALVRGGLVRLAFRRAQIKRSYISLLHTTVNLILFIESKDLACLQARTSAFPPLPGFIQKNFRNPKRRVNITGPPAKDSKRGEYALYTLQFSNGDMDPDGIYRNVAGLYNLLQFGKLLFHKPVEVQGEALLEQGADAAAASKIQEAFRASKSRKSAMHLHQLRVSGAARIAAWFRGRITARRQKAAECAAAIRIQNACRKVRASKAIAQASLLTTCELIAVCRLYSVDRWQAKDFCCKTDTADLETLFYC